MSARNRCPRCGNIIQPYMNGTCRVCNRYQQLAPWKDKDDLLGFSMPPEKPPSPEAIAKLRARRMQRPAPPPTPMATRSESYALLLGINAFLRDVFQRPVQISDILADAAIHPPEATTWSDHRAWMVYYLGVVDDSLDDTLKPFLTELHIRVLRRRYGFDGVGERSVSEVASVLGITLSNVTELYEEAIVRLRGNVAQMVVRALFVDVARRTLAQIRNK